MTDLQSTLERYVNMRQGLGYKFQRQAQRLADFVSFMEKRKAVTITTKLAVKWATLPPDRNASWALRLAAVRGIARHVASLNPKTEVPPPGILPSVLSPMFTATRRSMRCWQLRWACRQQMGCADGPTTVSSGCSQ